MQSAADVVADRAPAVVGETDARPVDLASAGAPLELFGDLHDLGDAGGSHRMPLAQQPAGGVDRDAPPDGGIAPFDHRPTLTRGAQADRFVGHDLGRGRRVVTLHQPEVLGPDAGELEGRLGAPRGGVFLAGDPVAAGLEHAGEDAHRPGDAHLTGLALADHDHRGSTIADW